MLGSARRMFRSALVAIVSVASRRCSLLALRRVAVPRATQRACERHDGRRRAAARHVREPGQDRSRPTSTSSCDQPRGARRRGPVTAHLAGPFESQGDASCRSSPSPRELQAGGQSFNAGATWTGDEGLRHARWARPTRCPSRVMKQFVAATSSRSSSARREAAAGARSLGIDFTKWLAEPRNEGTAKVGDAETIKITGERRRQAGASPTSTRSPSRRRRSRSPARRRVPQQLTPEQKRAAAERGQGR